MYGAKIKAFRIMRGFSQEDMATRLDIAQATYSKIEIYNRDGGGLAVEVWLSPV